MEHQFKRITRDSIPCWYELSWQKKEPAIILRVHRDFVESAVPIKQDAPIVIGLKEGFGFKKFTGSLNENFGFDDTLEIQAPKDKFTEFLIRIPEIKKLTKKKCRSCGGTGKGEFRADEKCFSCNGKGKEIYYDFKQAETISASLTVFFTLTMYCGDEKETSSSIPQLLTVQTITQRNMHGGSLWGEYSLHLRKWLASLWQDGCAPIPEMSRVMQTAYTKMFGPSDYIKDYNFRASVDYEWGWLNVDCPGDACGLHPEHGAEYDMKYGRGYKFSCHNVDNAGQQITLLAGLAALHDLARREIKNYEK
ncbi:MAG: hypothetical protein Q8N61_02580 [bacterium]|nr:hypothetical protein [bacterium]